MNQEARNCVMMVMFAAVYNVPQKVSQFTKKEIVGGQSTTDSSISEDCDHVLYLFSCLALVSLQHSRYKLIQ